MSKRDAINQVNGNIAVLASLIARQREVLDRGRAAGCATKAMELALQDLADLYRERLRTREALMAPSGPHRSSGYV